AQYRDVLRGERMKRAEARAELRAQLESPRHPLLVAREPGDVEPVRPADVERPLPVQVAQPWTARLGDDRAEVEARSHESRERKGHADRVGEAQVGEAAADPVAPRSRAWRPCLERLAQPVDAGLPALHPAAAPPL